MTAPVVRTVGPTSAATELWRRFDAVSRELEQVRGECHAKDYLIAELKAEIVELTGKPKRVGW